MSFSTYNNYLRANLAYKKPSLIKVIDIFLYNPIFVNYILYKLKLYTKHVWIFI